MDCGAQDVALASDSFVYDGLSPGSVSNGWVTSHSVDRRETDTGTLRNTVHRFDATYDAIGNLAMVRTQRNGSLSTVKFDYDAFGLVPTQTKLEATGVPSRVTSIEHDLVSLQPIRSTDPNHTTHGTDFDGFGRAIRATVALPGASQGVVSTMSYLGFANPDTDGRRLMTKWFSDPVAPASVATAAGRTGTVFLDELGRTRRSELALGSDYGNEVLVVGSRVYDQAGRVVFEADPFPKSQNSATAYGTSYHFTDTGDLSCTIRGQGRQPFNPVTDMATERLPTCLQRSFSGHVDTLDVRDAASLEASSPQAGVVKRRIATAIGRVTERSAFNGGLWLEFATFGYDRLGQLTTMVRFGDPAGLTNDVQWSWKLDSLGEILELTEPETAKRSHSYSDWGELVETSWKDGGIERQLVRRYDALSRLTATEERNDGITDPETVTTYAYDTGVTVSPLVTPTFVLGQLARATSASGQVTFSYDAFGRMNARVFTDNQGGLYIDKTTHSAGGRLAALEFNLPDQNHQKELVKYTYDSAGRLRGMTYVDASGGREIYRAENIDPFGRVQKATMGGHVDVLADYASEGRRRIRSASVESPTSTRRVSFDQFDPVGRELSRREIKDGATTETKVTYDALGRLRDVMKVDGGTTLPEWAYSYDALGNLFVLRDFIGSAGATLSYRSGDRDRVCRIGYGPGGLGGTACNVVYDDVGNTVEQATRTGTRRLDYFASGNVRHITEGAAQASFRYDPFGAVQELDITGVGVTDTRHDRRYGGLIERRDLVANGTPKTFIFRQIPGPGGIVATRRGATQDWTFGFGELRGNRFFTNQDGTFVQEVKYEPFGEAKSSGASPGTTDYTSYQWNGGDALAAFRLSHLGARLYDPVIGRFLSRDPLLIARAATTSNPYAFAANDPLNASDPSGLDPCGWNDPCISFNYSTDQPGNLLPAGLGAIWAASRLVRFFGSGSGSGSAWVNRGDYIDVKPWDEFEPPRHWYQRLPGAEWLGHVIVGGFSAKAKARYGSLNEHQTKIKAILEMGHGCAACHLTVQIWNTLGPQAINPKNNLPYDWAIDMAAYQGWVFESSRARFFVESMFMMGMTKMKMDADIANQWMPETPPRIGPAYRSFDEAFGQGGHVAEVIVRTKNGRELFRWWEASEGGPLGLAGHTEQKALSRIKLGPDIEIEIDGWHSPCPWSQGCMNSMRALAEQYGTTIDYRSPRGTYFFSDGYEPPTRR